MSALEIISAESARALTNDIQTTITKAWLLIQQAYTSRAWAALGYSTWDAYCETEFRSYRLKLPLEDRREAVASLREAGLSVRAIASGIGISKNTVTADLAQVSQTDPPAAVTARRNIGLDARLDDLDQQIEVLTAAERDLLAQCEATIDTGMATLTELGMAKKITGTDGKKYTPPSPREKPRRRPITDQAHDAGWELNRAVEKVARITRDDRFEANRDAVVMKLRQNLSRSAEIIDELLAHKVIDKAGRIVPGPSVEAKTRKVLEVNTLCLDVKAKATES
jgi:transposase-like protein